jgi:hypothetical protein
MVIRGRNPHDVAPHQHAGVRPTRDQPASPIQRLLDFGAAKTPVEAKKLVAELLASLRAAGFPVPATGSAESQLGQSLKLFQEEKGLPQTGVLDKETREALVDAGLLPHPGAAEGADSAAGASKSEAPARFDLGLRPKFTSVGGGELGLPQAGKGEVPEGAKSARGVELDQAVDKAARDKPPEIDLKSFLSSLRAAGFAGQGKGAEQLKDAIKKLQKAEGLPQTGQLDKRTADALVKRGIVDERALSLTTQSGQPDARAEVKDARQDPSTRGAKDGDPDVARGRGEVEGKGSGKDGAGGDASSSATEPGAGSRGGEPAGAAGKTGDVEDPWREGHDGNAPAGDDDVDDERRGHANVDDGGARDEGYWQVKPLSEQIAAGLASIARDDDGKGAATYAWDFTLLRPGIYGAKQPAPKLFHLVVTKASPFDGLWEQARAALNEKLRILEPDAKQLEKEDLERALRMARVRDVVKS